MHKAAHQRFGFDRIAGFFRDSVPYGINRRDISTCFSHGTPTFRVPKIVKARINTNRKTEIARGAT